MSERNKNKRTLICLSTEEGVDSEEEEDGDEEDEESSDHIFSQDGIDDVEEEESQSDDSDDGDAEDSLCNRVICLLEEGGDLGALNLKDCKAYLRKHGLRVLGTKTVCIQRIKEHRRIKDGNGEALYPESSFVINCTGDVCQGDVVLFTQKVYKKFDKVTRHGRFLGKRTIAGRVVSDSYGAAKQQHTFTIEILWSKGINKLPPLFPLLVKGRNLYKLKTYRQRWNDEAERLKVLAEKHERGTEARFIRAIRKTKKMRTANGGLSKKRKITEPEKGKCVGLGKPEHARHVKFNDYPQEVSPSTILDSKQNVRSGGSQFSWRRKNLRHLNDNKVPRFGSFTHHRSPYPSQIEFQKRNVPFHLSSHNMSPRAQTEFRQRKAACRFSGHDISRTSASKSLLHFNHESGAFVVPNSQYQGLPHCNYSHHAHSNPNYGFEIGNSCHFPELMTVDRSSQQFHFETESSRQRKNDIRSVFR